MRSLVIAAGILLVVLVVGAGCSAPEQAIYQKHGLSFTYPPAWNLTEDDADTGGNVTLTFDLGSGSQLFVSTTPNLSAQFPPTERLDVLNRWFTESRAHLLNVGAAVIEEKQVMVADNPAHRMLYALRYDDIAYRNVLVVTARGDTGYTFHLWALPRAHEQLVSELDAVLGSFQTG